MPIVWKCRDCGTPKPEKGLDCDACGSPDAFRPFHVDSERWIGEDEVQSILAKELRDTTSSANGEASIKDASRAVELVTVPTEIRKTLEPSRKKKGWLGKAGDLLGGFAEHSAKSFQRKALIEKKKLSRINRDGLSFEKRTRYDEAVKRVDRIVSMPTESIGDDVKSFFDGLDDLF